MPIEYEYRFRLHKDGPLSKNELIKGVSASKSTESTTYLLTNIVYASATDNYVRIRDSKNVHTGETETILTVKSKAPGTDFDDEDEVNICASKEQNAEKVLCALGCKHQYTIQKLRTVVHVAGLGELDFDEAPGLPPFVEVEATSKRKLDQLVKLLGLTGKNEIFSIADMYLEEYGISKENRSNDLLFSKPSNLVKNITKQRSIFTRLLAQQRKLIKCL
jgi:adenylate cyclase class IV